MLHDYSLKYKDLLLLIYAKALDKLAKAGY